MDSDENQRYSETPSSSSNHDLDHQQLGQQRRLIRQHQQQLYNLLPQPAHYYPGPPDGPQLTPSPTSAVHPWTTRGELNSSIRQQYEQYQNDQQEYRQQLREKQAMTYNADDKSSAGASSSASTPILPPPPPPPLASARTVEDPMPSTSDFVKKLYKMLEDPSFQSVVCWGPLGDCFVVKDMNEFTKSILPRMFKHSNFASFVRQLNKYDFHKVKNTDDNQFGEHSWTFRHPDFHADRRDALENIKRKVPATRKTNNPAGAASTSTSGGGPASASGSNASSSNAASSSSLPYVPHSHSSGSHSHSQSHSQYPGSSGSGSIQGQYGNPSLASSSARRSSSPSRASMSAEIQRLRDEGEDLRGRIRSLERNYESVVVEMAGFQRGMAQQDGLMQNLIAYSMGGGVGGTPGTTGDGGE